MPQGVRLRHVRLSPRDARVTAPSYREAVALVVAQDAVNRAYSTIGDKLAGMVDSPIGVRLTPMGEAPHPYPQTSWVW